ncbi:MAG: WbqC family protein [Candidatus Omnitrophica bacterium]|nr:WbqC family protein [Candidatus Omnitrophota bacterium]
MKNKRIAIMQPGYFPWLGFFELMYKCDFFVFLDDVQYTRRDWRNRNRLRSSDGWQWITVPVFSKDHSNIMIKDIIINNTVNWKKKHLNIIKINYVKAKFFNDYYKELESLLSCEWKNLSELAIYSTLFLRDKLGIKTPCMRSSSLNIKERKSNKILKICQAMGADELFDTKASRNFLDKTLFKRGNIKIIFQNYGHPAYQQVQKPFLEYMSALDLLINCGSQSLEVILGQQNN